MDTNVLQIAISYDPSEWQEIRKALAAFLKSTGPHRINAAVTSPELLEATQQMSDEKEPR